MKIRPFIIWGFVVLIYGITVAISIDQIHERDATILRQKNRVDELESKLPQITRSINKMQAENVALIQRFEEEKVKLENNQKIQKSIQDISELATKIQQSQPEESPKESISLQENAKRQIAERKEILESMQSQAQSSPVYSSSASRNSNSDSPPPPWFPPSQSAASKIIKDKASSEWKDNYRMVNYSIEKETAAFNKLLQYNKTGNPAVKTQLAKAAQEWPNNYSMMVYSLETQLEAKQKLNGK